VMWKMKNENFVPLRRKMYSSEQDTNINYCVCLTFMPHMAAEAGLVPCAETGIKHTLRWLSPLDSW